MIGRFESPAERARSEIAWPALLHGSRCTCCDGETEIPGLCQTCAEAAWYCDECEATVHAPIPSTPDWLCPTCEANRTHECECGATVEGAVGCCAECWARQCDAEARDDAGDF